jgi:hypothetical protein
MRDSHLFGKSLIGRTTRLRYEAEWYEMHRFRCISCIYGHLLGLGGCVSIFPMFHHGSFSGTEDGPVSGYSGQRALFDGDMFLIR